MHALVADHRDDDEPDTIVVGIETDRGPWVQALLAAGYQVFAINPLSAARYRERHVTSGAKSDPGDAKVLADLVRTDRQHHRPIAGDSDLADAIKALAPAHQNLIWTRQRQASQLRSTLREFYPGALHAFDELAGRDALAVLQIAPTPAKGRTLSRTKIASIELLELEQNAHFERHPDAKILLSQPGLGPILAARVLAEFGDDPTRYADVKARRNYAATSPITRASGTRRVVLARVAGNKRLRDALYLQAFAALSRSPGARGYHDTHRERGHTHRQALRALANRLVGILHGCLRHRQTYNETTAWPDAEPQLANAARLLTHVGCLALPSGSSLARRAGSRRRNGRGCRGCRRRRAAW